MISPHLAQEIHEAAKTRGTTYHAFALRHARNTQILWMKSDMDAQFIDV